MPLYDDAAINRIASKDGRKYGQFGKYYLRNGTPSGYEATPAGMYFDALLFITETVFETITDEELPEDDQDSLAGLVIPAGVVLQGRFTNISLLAETEGHVIAYKSRR